MKTTKKDIIQFIEWMRNGFAFCTSWFLILWVFFNRFYRVENISTDSLIKMMFFVAGGVFLFCLAFTRIFLKKWSFLRRLTCFMVLISLYECFGFYALGLWSGSGTLLQWFGFVGVVLILYLLCIGIYQIYSKKQGQIYTQALQNYQLKRSENCKE